MRTLGVLVGALLVVIGVGGLLEVMAGEGPNNNAFLLLLTAAVGGLMVWKIRL